MIWRGHIGLWARRNRQGIVTRVKVLGQFRCVTVADYEARDSRPPIADLCSRREYKDIVRQFPEFLNR